MRIEKNANASLQGLSANFIRLQKQRQAARAAVAQNPAAQPFAPARPAQVAPASSAVVAGASAKVAPGPGATPAAPSIESVRADTVQISPAAANAAKLDAQVKVERPTLSLSTETAPQTKTTAPKLDPALASAATPPEFSQKDVEAFQSSFGSTSADANFNASYDLDGNGTLNTLDLVRLLGRIR